MVVHLLDSFLFDIIDLFDPQGMFASMNICRNMTVVLVCCSQLHHNIIKDLLGVKWVTRGKMGKLLFCK